MFKSNYVKLWCGLGLNVGIFLTCIILMSYSGDYPNGIDLVKISRERLDLYSLNWVLTCSGITSMFLVGGVFAKYIMPEKSKPDNTWLKPLVFSSMLALGWVIIICLLGYEKYSFKWVFQILGGLCALAGVYLVILFVTIDYYIYREETSAEYHERMMRRYDDPVYQERQRRREY